MWEPSFRQELQCIKEVKHHRYIIVMIMWFQHWRQDQRWWPLLPTCNFQVGALATVNIETRDMSIISQMVIFTVCQSGHCLYRKLMFWSIALDKLLYCECYTLIYMQHVSLYSTWCFVIKCRRGRRQTKQGRMSQSQFGCVCRHGIIFKKLGIGSPIFTSKPVTGFESSIQAHN